MSRESRPADFHDYRHALEFDRRATRSDIRSRLAAELIKAMELKGHEWVLDIATGTGRFAQPVSKHLAGGRIVGLDEAQAMLSVARENARTEPLPGYFQTAGDAEALPFADGVFDCAFVAFSLHHFGHPSLMVKETHRVLRSGGRLFVVDPVFKEARDSLDLSLNRFINEVFRRSHGENFRFLSAGEIRELLAQAKFHVVRADLHSFSFDQDGMEGIPTGRHWLEVVAALRDKPLEMSRRFEQNYFVSQGEGKPHVKGSFNYALVCGEKG